MLVSKRKSVYFRILHGTVLVCFCHAFLYGIYAARADAMFDYYEAYNKGDFATAAVKIETLAKNGSPEAQYLLGGLFEQGKAYNQNFKVAFSWYSKAAEQGHLMAQMHLAFDYEWGQGTEKNEVMAQKWYRKAALQGSAFAQYEYGKLRYLGKGSNRDPVLAYAMFSMASTNGWKEAEEFKDKIMPNLTAEQLSHGDEIAEKCMGSHYLYCD